jgi:hypothetical protein
MWRLGLDPTLLCWPYPLFRSPLSNIILIYPPNLIQIRLIFFLDAIAIIYCTPEPP